MIRIDTVSCKFKFGQNINKKWPQILSALIMTTYGFFVGLSVSWTSPAIPKLLANDSYIPMTFTELANFRIFQCISMMLFSPFVSLTLDHLSRKQISYIASFLTTSIWLCIAFARNSILLYTSRIISGIVEVMFLYCVPTYVAEITEKQIRGRLGLLSSVMFSIGALVINLVGYYMTIPNCAFVMALGPLIHFFFVKLIPESPYWLIQKNRMEDAKRQLQMLRWREDVEEELEEIRKSVEKHDGEKGSYKELFTIKYNRKALLLASLTRLSQQFSGSQAINSFMQFIFEQAGGKIPRHISASICALLAGVSGISAISVIDKYGRKPLIFYSSWGAILNLVGLSAFFFAKSHWDTSKIDWLPLVLMLLFIISFSGGLAMIPAIMMGELFSSHIRNKAMLILTVLHGCAIIFATKLFQVLTENVGMFSPFLFYSIACAFLTIILHFQMKETKNKSLNEIQNILGCKI